LAPAAMAPAGAPFADQARLLQGKLNEAVRQPQRVVAAGEAVEVADVPAPVALAVEAQGVLDLDDGRLARRGQLAAIIQPEDPVGLIARPPASQAAGVDSQNIGGLQPRQRPRQGSANDLLSFHGPLHGGLGIEHERPPCCSWLYPSAPAKRTFHLLSGADRSCAPYIGLATFLCLSGVGAMLRPVPVERMPKPRACPCHMKQAS